MEISERELRRLLTEACELGAKKTLVELGFLKPYLSKNEAYKMYGRKQVDRWINEKLINLVKDGTDTSKIRLERMQLEIVAKTSNRMSWYKKYVPEEK